MIIREDVDQKTAEMLQQVLEKDLYMKNLGLELLELSPNKTVGRIPVKPETTNPYGTVHGGALYSVADIVAGFAACAAGYYVVTVSGNVNYLKPGKDTEYIYCEAICVKPGKKISVYDVKLLDDNGNLLQSGNFTFYATHEKV